MPATLLLAERLFDGARPLTDAAVLVDEGRIRRVGAWEAALPAHCIGNLRPIAHR